MSIGFRLCDVGRSYVANVRLNVFQHKRSYKHMILAMVVVRKEKPFASFIKCSCKICRRADVTHICYTNVVWAMRFVWFCYTICFDIADSRDTFPAQRQIAWSILSPAPVDRTGPHMRHCRQCVACPSCFFCCACLACVQFASPVVCFARFPIYNCLVYALLCLVKQFDASTL